jgi:hypothetical protein
MPYRLEDQKRAKLYVGRSFGRLILWLLKRSSIIQTFFVTTNYAANHYSGTYSGCQKNAPLNELFFCYNHLYQPLVFRTLFLKSGTNMEGGTNGHISVESDWWE